MPPLGDGFSARQETAADLGAALAARAMVVLVPDRVAGEGPGSWLESCGKTQLAVSAAESLWQSGRVDLLAWITASSRAAVLSGYAEAAADVMGASTQGGGEPAAARFTGWLSETSRQWLVVLDDLRDLADMAGLWPAGRTGRVLVTTADLTAFSGERGELVHRVGAYSPDEALSFLASRLGADPHRCQDASGLARELGYEPLALAQASAVIASSGQSCRDYLDAFARSRKEVTEAAGGSPAAAAITWPISAEHAATLAPDGAAQAILSLAALLNGDGMPAAVFTTPAARGYLAGGGKPAAAERARTALLAAQRAGLLSADLAGTAALVRMSATVQVSIRTAAPAGSLEAGAAAAADALLQAWPGDERPAWLAQALRSGTASLRRAAGGLLWNGGCHPLLLRAGQSLDRAVLTGPAVTYWKELAAVSDRILGQGHPDTLAIGVQLADAYQAAGQAADAVSQFRWVLAERVRVLGPDHPAAIGARRDLGRTLVAAGEFTDAMAVLDRALAEDERGRGPNELETVDARDDLAAARYAAGQFGDAIRLYRQTLASRESLQGPDHPDTMTGRQRLARAYLAGGKLRPALSQYKRVLRDRERVLGPDHLDTIAVCGTLASAYHSAGRMAAALQFYERARAGYERALGSGHPETLASCAGLARAYYEVGRPTDARTLLAATLVRCEQHLQPGDPLTESARRDLARMRGG